MTVLLSIFIVLAGLAFGSFLNVCVSRLPRHESVATPRSRCPQCLTPILNRDNLPLLGWMLLRGRCRSCAARIPLRYPLVEAAVSALFLLCFLKFGLTMQGIAAAIVCWLLLGLAATDAETMLLPDALTMPGLVLGILYSGLGASNGPLFSFQWNLAAQALLWAACAAAVILVIRGAYYLIRKREGIGLGDAKLIAMIAAWLGWRQTILVFFLAAMLAAAYGTAFLALRKSQRSAAGGPDTAARIPLGAFLGAAGIFSVFEGDSVLGWYLQFFR